MKPQNNFEGRLTSVILSSTIQFELLDACITRLALNSINNHLYPVGALVRVRMPLGIRKI